MLSGIALLWLLLAMGCMFLGILLTVRRRDTEPASVLIACRRCGEAMEPGARFCGVCGQYRYEKPISVRQRRYFERDG